jgi:hypothetical protein
LGWPVHGEVAGARDGGIAGDAVGCNRERGWVCCAREVMVKLKSYNNWTRTQQRGEGGTQRSEGRARRRWLNRARGKEEGVAEAGVEKGGAWRGPFIGARGEEGGERWRALGRLRQGGDGMARAGARG